MLKILVSVGVAGVVLAAAVVASADPLTNSTPPVASVQDDLAAVSGSTVLTTDGVWTVAPDSFTYKWLRDGGEIVGATASSYSLTGDDVGHSVRSEVTAISGPDSATEQSNAISVGSPTTAGTPTISGTATYDQVLTANENLGSWGGVPQPTVKDYQWLRNDTPILGATGKTYKLVLLDVGTAIKVSVTAGNVYGSDVTATSGATATVSGTPTTAGTPTISGTPTYDQVLTANENFATWGGVPKPSTATSYQWLRNDTPIPGAGSRTYKLVEGDVGTAIKVSVTAGNGYGPDVTATSGVTASVSGTPTTAGTPTISGSATVGQTLTANPQPNTWGGVPKPPTIKAYQWVRCNPTCADIVGATSATFALTAPADVGARIKVRVTAGNGYGDASAESAVTGQVSGAPVNVTAPTIDDTTPQVGQTLTGRSGNWTAFPAPTLQHQWQRCNAAGSSASCVSVGSAIATQVNTTLPATHTSTSTYAVTVADLGSTLRLGVTAQNSSGSPGVVYTAITQPIQAAPAQIAGQAPAVTGTLARGQTLTASSGQWTGFWTTGAPPVAFTHQWQRCQAGGAGCVNVNGDAPVAVPPTGAATCTSAAPCGGSSTYLLSDADMGSYIRVKVKATNGGGSVEVTSGLTGVVQGPPIILQAGGSPDPNAQPKISGIAQSGFNIGASTGSWSAYPGAITYGFQWLRCSGTDLGSCSAIGGATQTVYAVQDADVGQRLRVRINASNGVAPDGVATSEATQPVAARVAGAGGDGVDLLLSARASSSGPRVTYTLSATNAGNQGATGVTVNVQLSGAAGFVSASAPGGCSGSGPVSCALGAIGPGASGSATIIVQASQTGVIGFSASVGAAQADVNPSNNDVSVSAYVIASGSSPKAGTGTGGTSSGPGGAQIAGTTDQKFVALKDVTLKARRVGKTWVATTSFSLLSGRANLRLIVTRNGSTKELTLQAGSRFGGIVAGDEAAEAVAFTAAKPATFPIKVVLPARGFSLKQIYVIRITATAANGASSTLNIGFKGAPLVTKAAGATLRGNTQVVSSTFNLPAAKATNVQAWVSPATGAKKLGLLKGSRLGKVVATSTKNVLTMKATRAGTFPVSVVLAARSVAAKKPYVIRVRAKSADGLWTDYDIRFTVKPSPARALTRTRAATP